MTKRKSRAMTIKELALLCTADCIPSAKLSRERVLDHLRGRTMATPDEFAAEYDHLVAEVTDRINNEAYLGSAEVAISIHRKDPFTGQLQKGIERQRWSVLIVQKVVVQLRELGYTAYWKWDTGDLIVRW